jgi:hypothetical protein
METEAQRELRELMTNLASIKGDIAAHEISERPLDKSGLACLRERLGLAKDRLAEKTWTSYEAEQTIKGLESRLLKIEQE